MTDFIERRICIGAITSDKYIKFLSNTYSPELMEAKTANILIKWCLYYFHKFGEAPKQEIENIYTKKLQNNKINEDQAKWIQAILVSLSGEFTDKNINIENLIEDSKEYFTSQILINLSNSIQGAVEQGELKEAQDLILSYDSPIKKDEFSIINPFAKEARKSIKQAFSQKKEPLFTFPGAFGKVINSELVPQSFVAFMGPEKVGKTFILIEMAMRAMKKGRNVVFFQAGDMTEAQQIRRMAIYLSKTSDEPKYCEQMYVPVVDCLLNQLGHCEKKIREKNDPVFTSKEDITYEGLLEAYERYIDHIPCKNCKNIVGSVWFQERPSCAPLTFKKAYKTMTKFGEKYANQFRLATYPNETLTVAEMRRLLSKWEKEGFKADVLILDYADIVAPDPDFSRIEFRHQENKKWQRLRRLSQEFNLCLITVTQSKATSYSKKKNELITRSDFSEDKRKFAHVTAMYGLNQNPDEKRIGIMRINTLLLREGDFNIDKPVYILQRLQMGRPFLGSFF